MKSATTVIEALNAADVRAAVLTASDRGLPVAIYSTGHGTHVPFDGALVIKTSRMAEVLVDPDRRTARVGPGARWADVIAAAEPFGLAPISGSSEDVGVAGFTLGGGVGWLSRKHGFAADSLLRAEVVTASGGIVTATADRNAGLFWALRGGGGNFGVVTAMEIRLHEVPRVYGGIALYEPDRAADLLTAFRADMPDELNVSVVLMRESPHLAVDGPVAAVRGIYAGEPVPARRALERVFAAAGEPLIDNFRPMAYSETRDIGGTAPRQVELLADLDDGAIAAVLEAAQDADNVEVRRWGGAMAKPGGPVGHRDIPFSVTVDGQTTALAPHATGGSFLNFLHDTSRTHTAYTPENLARLRDVKAAYDPDDVFSRGHAIAPSEQAAEARLGA